MLDPKKIAEWEALNAQVQAAFEPVAAAILAGQTPAHPGPEAGAAMAALGLEAVPALLAERRATVALLRECGAQFECPICHVDKPGHAPDCRLAPYVKG